MADTFPVFRANKITHLLLCGHEPIKTERGDRHTLIVHFPVTAKDDALEYEKARYAVVAWEKAARTPTAAELLESVCAA